MLTSQEKMFFNQDRPEGNITKRLIILAKEIVTFSKDISYVSALGILSL